MKMKSAFRENRRHRRGAGAARWAGLLLLSLLIFMGGCSSGRTGKKENEFFTSGSREADQRASQKMAQAKQLADSGNNSEDEAVKQAKGNGGAAQDGTHGGAKAEGKLALFERLGAMPGISNIVADFIPRALHDPRVNWDRSGTTRGGLFHRESEAAWSATPENVAALHKHLAQFIALATGGPATYDGEEIKATHAGMRITNPEFDAVIGDLKASLDKLRVPDREQKELLAIVESTRPQIVTER